MALPNGGSAYQVSDGNVEADKLLGGPALVATSGAGIYFLTTAITANTTTTTVVSGSIGVTTNATGVGKLFISDGAKWQFAVVA
jgi:hypothetical protein